MLPSQDVLDDLSTRFILNCPKEELASFERMLFLIEQAHWFYEDFYREQDDRLKSLGLKEFTSLMFSQCAALQPYQHMLDTIYKRFTAYKHRVPVCGAILLDENYEWALLVKGWKSSSGWGFPRGKINKGEPDRAAAAREVYEETGLDIGPLIQEHDKLEVTIMQQRTCLYIVSGIPKDRTFAPVARKEISNIAWHRICDLPYQQSGDSTGIAAKVSGKGSQKFFMVWPFILPLKQWIRKNVPQARLGGRSGKKPQGTQDGQIIKVMGDVDHQGSATTAINQKVVPTWPGFTFDAERILATVK